MPMWLRCVTVDRKPPFTRWNRYRTQSAYKRFHSMREALVHVAEHHDAAHVIDRQEYRR